MQCSAFVTGWLFKAYAPELPVESLPSQWCSFMVLLVQPATPPPPTFTFVIYLQPTDAWRACFCEHLVRDHMKMQMTVWLETALITVHQKGSDCPCTGACICPSGTCIH